ncbi:MAG: nucleoside recognition domain-containing protein [Planctomycetota bacterium]
MLNRIWFWLIALGVFYGAGKAGYQAFVGVEPDPNGVVTPPAEILSQAGQNLTTAAIEAAELSVEICLGIAGTMILWLGILQVAKDAGLVDSLARALRPLMRWLFPEVPDDHPAQGAMLMNMSANILGLDNAATPFGLKAMTELQELNDDKETATNSMAMFLAINTSSVTLIPM